MNLPVAIRRLLACLGTALYFCGPTAAAPPFSADILDRARKLLILHLVAPAEGIEGRCGFEGPSQAVVVGNAPIRRRCWMS